MTESKITAPARSRTAGDAIGHDLPQSESAGPATAFAVRRFHTPGIVHHDDAGGRVINQMYVERVSRVDPPPSQRIVLVHGTDQTGLCYLQTPDGRPGWAYDLAGLGWDVYVVDQIARGRSAYDPTVHGTLTRLPLREVEALFTGPAAHQRFPHAFAHTQWPGGPGVHGNPAFDAFAASQVASLADLALAEDLNTAALGQLLRRIGPAVLVTHSQASVFGFQLCDREPGLVTAHLTIEPNGPPFYDVSHVGAPQWYASRRETGRPWGLTRRPLQYQPPAEHPDQLHPVLSRGGEAGQFDFWLQAEPVRSLPRLARTPQAVITAAASYRTDLDPWTYRYLVQAGVPAMHYRLADYGLDGNGHMMMLEANSSQIAHLLSRWALTQAKPGPD